MEPPERDALVVAEALERHPQELRRAVDDHQPDLAVEDPQEQPVKEDPRSAGVVDHDVPVAEDARELFDRRVEVAVPAVVLDRVVLEPEAVDGPADPVLVGNTRDAFGPGEARALATRGDGPAVARMR